MTLARPIGELQQSISWSEYELWIDYRNKYGPLNPIRKYDQGPAIIASHMNNLHGGKATMDQFILYGKDLKEEEPVNQIKAFMKSIGGRVKIGRK